MAFFRKSSVAEVKDLPTTDELFSIRLVRSENTDYIMEAAGPPLFQAWSRVATESILPPPPVVPQVYVNNYSVPGEPGPQGDQGLPGEPGDPVGQLDGGSASSEYGGVNSIDVNAGADMDAGDLLPIHVTTGTTTDITGLLKGNGVNVSAGLPGTDYLAPSAIGTTVQGYNVNTTTLGNATTGTGSLVLETSPTLITPAIGVATATSLNVSNQLVVGGGITLAIRAITSARTLDATDYKVECTANSFPVELPSAVGIAGRPYIIKNSGNGIITVTTTLSQTIDGMPSGAITLTRGAALEVSATVAGNWMIH